MIKPRVAFVEVIHIFCPHRRSICHHGFVTSFQLQIRDKCAKNISLHLGLSGWFWQKIIKLPACHFPGKMFYVNVKWTSCHPVLCHVYMQEVKKQGHWGHISQTFCFPSQFKFDGNSFHSNSNRGYPVALREWRYVKPTLNQPLQNRICACTKTGFVPILNQPLQNRLCACSKTSFVPSLNLLHQNRLCIGNKPAFSFWINISTVSEVRCDCQGLGLVARIEASILVFDTKPVLYWPVLGQIQFCSFDRRCKTCLDTKPVLYQGRFCSLTDVGNNLE